jgi:hypothetical protein
MSTSLRISIFNVLLFFSVKTIVAQDNKSDSLNAVKTLSVGNVTLVDFSANFFGDRVKLKWAASSEKNVQMFYVRRSVDHANWYVVANAQGRENGTVLKKYESLDKTASGGINFYKLSFVDLAGKETDLKIVNIDMEDKSKEIKVIPDNISSTIKVESAEQIMSIELELTDLLQRSYFVSFVTDNTHEITVITGGLSPGTYFLKCHLNKNRYAVKKVMVD